MHIYIIAYLSMLLFLTVRANYPWKVDSCHQGMARPQVADGRAASNKESSCEYME